MRLRFGQDKDRLILSEAECEMGRSTYSPSMSVAELDPDSQVFTATLDHLRFKTILEVVKQVLDANGFVTNLENMLAVLDTLHLGILAKTTGDDELVGVRAFTDCLSFRLPRRNTRGHLLIEFYREIEAYELALKNFTVASDSSEEKVSKKSRDEEREALKKARAEAQDLKSQVRVLVHELSQLQKSHRQATKSLDANNILPEHYRIGSISTIDSFSREVQIKLGRKALRVPLVTLSSVPEEGQKCIVHIEGGTVKGVVLLEARSSKSVAVRTAQILYVRGDECKVRDNHRSTHVLKAQNDVERSMIQGFQKQDTLLVSLRSGQILKFQPLSEGHHGKQIVDLVGDRITTNQVEKALSESADFLEEVS